MAKTKQTSKAEVKSVSTIKFSDTTIALILGAIAFLIYTQTIGYDYALDDVAVIKSNKFVHMGFGGIGRILHTFYWAGFWETNAGLFRPVSLILFAIEWAFAPNSPHLYHFTNVLLYAVSAFLLYRVLRKIFRDQSVILPIASVLLWIVLPVHTEVVANIKSADEILSVIFFLLSTDQLLKWQENRTMRSMLFAGAYLFLALLSKEGAVLFIPMAFLALLIFRGEKIKDLVKPGIVFAAITVVWYAYHAYVIASAPMQAIKYDRGDNILTAAPDLLHQFATAMNMQGHYFQKLLLGYPLAFDYSYNQIPVVGLGDPLALFAIAIWIGAIFIAIRKFTTEPVLSFAILFYFVTFALTSNVFFLIGATMADRFLFVPSIGSCIAISYLLMNLFNGVKNHALASKALYVILPVSLLYTIRTYSRSQDWETEQKLYTADAENSPESGRVRQNYGITLMNTAFATAEGPERQRLLDLSYQELTAAVKIDTSDFRSLLCLGQVEYNRGHYQQSAAWSKKNIDYFHARGYSPNDLSIYSNLGDAYMMYGRADSAILAFTAGLKADPKNDYVCTNLATAYLSSKDTVKALEYLENSVKLNPGSDRAWDKLANVCGMAKKYQRSAEAFIQLSKLRPADTAPYKMIATAYMNAGDTAKANQYWGEYIKRGGK